MTLLPSHLGGGRPQRVGTERNGVQLCASTKLNESSPAAGLPSTLSMPIRVARAMTAGDSAPLEKDWSGHPFAAQLGRQLQPSYLRHVLIED